MMSSKRTVLACTLLAAAAPLSCFGNGARLPGQDAWVVAQGHAGTASVDSSASVWFNAAGLTRVPQDEILVEPTLLHLPESFTSAATGRTTSARKSDFFTPSAFAAHRVSDTVVLGFGALSPYGLSTDWPTDSGFAGLATYNQIKYLTGVVSAGWQFLPNLALGASIEYSSAKADLNRLTPIGPGVVTAYGFKGDDRAWSGNLGVQWKVTESDTLGVHYQLPTTLHFLGTATLQGVMSQPGHASGWTFPDNLAVGYEHRFGAGWSLELGADRTFWSHTKVVHLDAGPLSTDLPLGWNNSMYYSIGFTKQLNPQWRIAGGYSYSENSIPDRAFNPSLPDVTRNLLDGGLEWSNGPWTIRAVSEYGLHHDRTISTPLPDGLGGSATGTYHDALFAVGGSVGYRF